MGVPKKLVSFLIKFMLVFIIVIAVCAGGLFVYYVLTLQNAEEYVPDDFALYLKVDSVRQIYDNVLDLKAADVVFSTPQLRFIYNAVLEFKSNEFFKTELFRQLLDRSAYFLITKDFSPVIIFDPGLLSLGTRALPLLQLFYNFDRMNIKVITKGDITIYNYRPAPGQDFYFSLNNNLIFLSTKQQHIEKLYDIKKSGKNIKNNEELTALGSKLTQKGFIRLYLNTMDLIGGTLNNIPELRLVLQGVKLNPYSVLSFFISNDELHVNAYTDITVSDPTFGELLRYNAPVPGVLNYLPQNTNIFSCINFKTFKNMYQTALYLEGSQIGDVYKSVDDACRLIFGTSVDDLFFNWTGSEAGAITMAGSADPVVYLKIKDKSKLEYAFKKIDESLVLDTDRSLVLDEVRVGKIAFPGFIKMIVDAFVKGIETPYYIVIDDYVFFSMNPELLAKLSNDRRAGKLLIRDGKYETVAKNVSQDANVFMYYNFGASMPRFLGYGTLLTKLLRLYEKGIFAVKFTDTELNINIAAAGIAGGKTLPYPGFPKELEYAPTSDIICKNISGSGTPEIIYTDERNYLVESELFGDSTYRAQVEDMSTPYITAGNDIMVFSRSGTIYKFDSQAKPLSPFPMATAFKNSFAPVPAGSSLILYSQSDKALFLISPQGETEKITPALEHDILSPPAYLDGLLAYYPKSFESKVWLSDLKGNVQSGWPQEAGGISFCSPVLFRDEAGRVLVAFLTQAGELDLWDATGKSVRGFPVQEGRVYYADPVPMAFGGTAAACLVTLSEDGTVSLIDLRGNTIKSKQVPEAANKNAKLTVFDFDRDGTAEIFIYGAGNIIVGLDAKLNILPGFPIPGSQRPGFADLNYDGKYEIIVGSFDKNLYVYTLDK
jgi:hypothetical protein